jgi:hypothetical protein
MAIELQPAGPSKPKLLEQVRVFMRARRYSLRTEQAYLDWIQRFIRFHGVRHPLEMEADEVKGVPSHLATQMRVR